MNPDQKKPIVEIQFDEFGRYEITEITDEELDLVSGGDEVKNSICPDIICPGNILCPTNPPPPPAPAPPSPKPNQKCGEDGDDE